MSVRNVGRGDEPLFLGSFSPSLETLRRGLQEGGNFSSVVEQHKQYILENPDSFFSLLEETEIQKKVSLRGIPAWIWTEFSTQCLLLAESWFRDSSGDWLGAIPEELASSNPSAYLRVAQQAFSVDAGDLRDLPDSLWVKYPQECYEIAASCVLKGRGSWSDLSCEVANVIADQIFSFIGENRRLGRLSMSMILVTADFAIQHKAKYLPIISSLLEEDPSYISVVPSELYPELFESDFRKVPRAVARGSPGQYFSLVKANVLEGKGSFKEVDPAMALYPNEYFECLEALLSEGGHPSISEIVSESSVILRNYRFLSRYRECIIRFLRAAFDESYQTGYGLSEAVIKEHRNFLKDEGAIKQVLYFEEQSPGKFLRGVIEIIKGSENSIGSLTSAPLRAAVLGANRYVELVRQQAKESFEAAAILPLLETNMPWLESLEDTYKCYETRESHLKWELYVISRKIFDEPWWPVSDIARAGKNLIFEGLAEKRRQGSETLIYLLKEFLDAFEARSDILTSDFYFFKPSLGKIGNLRLNQLLDLRAQSTNGAIPSLEVFSLMSLNNEQIAQFFVETYAEK